ncbi:spore germination-like protein [Iocasia frigidifontis]|uniref:Spore germination-like protein n=1 Tax=Iocasia fonsfrigidae TaxID=2682810 RepID=A0A8A7KBZ8_9FIRM|nr:GerMN domain-containing protein [Iocasia fonsfrigidae]QTL97098.1 spore germination-like protein [Iocasia fonsfrigidae]
MSRRSLLIYLLILIIGFIIVYNIIGEQDFSGDDSREVIVYYATRDAMYLDQERRTVKQDGLYRNTVEELLKGPETSSLSPTIPEGVELLKLSLRDNIIYLDFNNALLDNHWGGSTGESLTVYSIVNTMVQFEEIDAVQILIEGEKIETLAGHMYLLEPLEMNESIVKK